ncbi:hypothetical protein HY490_00365 [Candidatus Woesearchaeota archaeon]|nr:hypothetical protein [Candidatus Woesearchaeota archaeon]
MKPLVHALVFLIVLSTVNAIGISPPRIIAEGMNRGTQIEKLVFLSGVNSRDEVTIAVEGEVASWVSVDRELRFTVPDATPEIPLVFRIAVPQDKPNGKYTGTARLTSASRTPLTGQQTSVSVVAGVTLSFDVEVTGEQVKAYKITSVTLPPTSEQAPITLIITIDNTGNVAVKPSLVKLMIADKFKQSLLSSANLTATNAVAGHTKGNITLVVPQHLKPEEYWARVEVYDGTTVKFSQESVLEITTTQPAQTTPQQPVQILLKQVVVPPTVRTNDVIKLSASLENPARPVSAKFLAEIYKGERLVKVVESPVEQINTGHANLTAYFTPTEDGAYTVKAYVLYESVKTPLKESSFVVGGIKKTPPVEKKSWWSKLLILLVLITAGYVAFHWWRKTHRRRIW